MKEILFVSHSFEEADRFERLLRAAGVANPFRHIRDELSLLAHATLSQLKAYKGGPGFSPLFMFDLTVRRNGVDKILRWVANHPTLSRHLKVCLLGGPDAQKMAEVYNDGADTFLVKPVRAWDIVELARMCPDQFTMEAGSPTPQTQHPPLFRPQPALQRA